MRALVLGGAGYIGSHMVRHLTEQGHQVWAMDDLSTGHREALGPLPLIVGSVRAEDDLDRALDQTRPDCVLHFAACSLVAESMIEPLRYYKNNVSGTLCLLEALRRWQIPRLVFSSTAAVYGIPRSVPIHEDDLLAPINTYGWSKLFAERMIEDACRSHGLRASVLRYFNAAGAHSSGDIGEAHDPETHLIPNVLRAALGTSPRVLLNGDRHATADGYCVRDFIHVEDLCEAHLVAAEALGRESLPGFQVYNLGSGRGYSVIEVLRAAEAVVGHAIPSRLADARPGDPPALVADVTRAREVLGWSARRPQIADIIETAWRWHQRPRF